MHFPSRLIMVRPVRFGFNEQTSGTNAFQNNPTAQQHQIQEQALKEFNHFVHLLQEKGIEVQVFDDTADPETPDSIFPNNWFSMHENNQLLLYPMMAPNRRLERRTDIIDQVRKSQTELIDLSGHESNDQFFEGTGSMVLDYENKIAYAALSPRSNKDLFLNICKSIGFQPIVFHAADKNGAAIYHTNVLLCIGDRFAVICSECIREDERELVEQELIKAGKTLLRIDFEQLNHFAGNMYQVFDPKGKSIIILSQQAYGSLREEQRSCLTEFGELLPIPLQTIETYGGGSARCMIAENRLPL